MLTAGLSSAAPGPPGIHLSVVATSRNDDHGGSLLRRMQHFVDGLVAQARRHRIAMELILVEWNPPPGRPPLAEALRWPEDNGHCTIRIITVPPELHGRLKHGDQLPLFQMIAKNVGIRRARGRYILATNIDILFSDGMVRYLRDDLVPGRLYRADRCDVPAEVPGGVPFEEVLDFCHREMFRINTIGRTLIKRDGRWRQPPAAAASGMLSSTRRLVAGVVRRSRQWLDACRDVPAALDAVGRHLGRAGARRVGRVAVKARRVRHALARSWRRARQKGLSGSLAAATRWTRGRTVAAARDARRAGGQAARASWRALEDAARATGRGMRRAALALERLARSALAGARAGAAVLGRAGRSARAWPSSLSRRVRAIVRPDRLFTNACGDFTLLSREDWFRLRGYPEWEIFSWHLDSVLLYQANRSGIREVYAGQARKIFHIEHGRGSGYTPEGVAELFARLDARGVPYLTWPDFLALVDEMDAARRDGQPVLYNAGSWGLAEEALPEALIGEAPRRHGPDPRRASAGSRSI